MSPQFKWPFHNHGFFSIQTEFQLIFFRLQKVTAERFVETIWHSIFKLILQNIKVNSVADKILLLMIIDILLPTLFHGNCCGTNKLYDVPLPSIFLPVEEDNQKNYPAAVGVGSQPPFSHSLTCIQTFDSQNLSFFSKYATSFTYFQLFHLLNT